MFASNAIVLSEENFRVGQSRTAGVENELSILINVLFSLSRFFAPIEGTCGANAARRPPFLAIRVAQDKAYNTNRTPFFPHNPLDPVFLLNLE